MTASDIAVDERVSPLAHWHTEFETLPAGVQLKELPFLTQLSLRLEDDPEVVTEASRALGVELPQQPCTSTADGGVTVLWLGPSEWLVVTPGTGRDLESRLHESVGGRGAVVDVSGQRTTLHLTGPRARDLLAHGCSIDLHPRVNHAGSCVQTHLAKAGIILVTRNEEGTDFWVLVRTSFADYLATWLVDASVPHQRDPQWQ